MKPSPNFSCNISGSINVNIDDGNTRYSTPAGTEGKQSYARYGQTQKNKEG